MKKVFKILYSALYTFVILIGILLLVTLFPIDGNFQVKIVSSGSMEPAIKVGSIVVIKPHSQYGVGDIVTFGGKKKNEIPTTHRIVSSRVSSGTLLFATKGDANNAVDPSEITEKDIVGKVLFSVPFIGYIIDFARKPVGIILIIVIPAFFIVYDEVVKIIKEVKKIKKKKMKEQKEKEEIEGK